MSDGASIPLADAPPVASHPTDYDWAHRIAYLRLLDAQNEGADWHDVASAVLGLDIVADPDIAKAVWSAHLARAVWMRDQGYRGYLTGGANEKGGTTA